MVDKKYKSVWMRRTKSGRTKLRSQFKKNSSKKHKKYHGGDGDTESSKTPSDIKTPKSLEASKNEASDDEASKNEASDDEASKDEESDDEASKDEEISQPSGTSETSKTSEPSKKSFICNIPGIGSYLASLFGGSCTDESTDKTTDKTTDDLTNATNADNQKKNRR